MKSILISVLLVGVSSATLADQDKTDNCIRTASLFASTAQNRDSGLTPKEPFNISATYKGVTLEQRKKIINLVYFDSDFARSRGSALQSQMLNLCLHGPNPEMRPLK